MTDALILTDEALERRLRALAVDCAHTDGWEVGGVDILEAADRIEGYGIWADNVRRLTRDLDVEMHGEAGAARQASLCDLIGCHADALQTATDAATERHWEIAALAKSLIEQDELVSRAGWDALHAAICALPGRGV